MIALWQLAVPSVEVLLLTKRCRRAAKRKDRKIRDTAPSFLVLLALSVIWGEPF
jgi:hypothetical protein